jgi:hypothetical protein
LRLGWKRPGPRFERPRQNEQWRRDDHQHFVLQHVDDLAFEWLERALAQQDPGIFWTKVDPLLRSLHADPRWITLLRELRLAD